MTTLWEEVSTMDAAERKEGREDVLLQKMVEVRLLFGDKSGADIPARTKLPRELKPDLVKDALTDSLWAREKETQPWPRQDDGSKKCAQNLT